LYANGEQRFVAAAAGHRCHKRQDFLLSSGIFELGADTSC
jgi:hypothetical protein